MAATSIRQCAVLFKNGQRIVFSLRGQQNDATTQLEHCQQQDFGDGALSDNSTALVESSVDIQSELSTENHPPPVRAMARLSDYTCGGPRGHDPGDMIHKQGLRFKSFAFDICIFANCEVPSGTGKCTPGTINIRVDMLATYRRSN